VMAGEGVGGGGGWGFLVNNGNMILLLNNGIIFLFFFIFLTHEVWNKNMILLNKSTMEHVFVVNCFFHPSYMK